MKTFLYVLLTAALLLAACGAPPTGAPFTPTTTRDPASATVSEVVNDVKARPAPDASLEPVDDGFVFGAGGQVQTGEASKARLDLSDGSILRLAESSSFVLEAAAPSEGGLVTRLQLTFGKIWVSLTGGAVEVETPVGVAAVRGSFAVFEYDPGDPDDPTDDVLVVGCLEGSCSAHNDTVDEQLGNLEQITLTHGGQEVERVTLTGAAVQEFLQNNPEVAEAIVATLTAAPPATDTPAPALADTDTPTPTLASAADTPVDTSTSTPAHTATRTPRPTLRFTLTPSHTPTSTATSTFTPSPTATCEPGLFFDPFQRRCRPPDPTNTPIPAFTATPIPTDTPTFTPIPDTQGPSITNLGSNPGSLDGSNCDITFFADINDPAGVSSAGVNWTVYDGSGMPFGSGSVGLSGPSSGGNYSGTATGMVVPPFGSIAWSVSAIDGLGYQSSATGPNLPESTGMGCNW